MKRTSYGHYIVYMGEHSQLNSDVVVSANQAMVASVTASESEAANATIHHYSKSFRGFSAMLTPEQAGQLKESDEVISVFENKLSELHSTHSWDFLDVKSPSNFGREFGLQSDVIVGSIDTGIWPESKSYDDKHLGPVPDRFKGKCVTGQNFTQANCNRKIIGARYYLKGFEADMPLQSVGKLYFRSARDADGHGTHTTSTIAGSIAHNTSLFGIGSGHARGGVVGARIAVYKACWFAFCSDADILAAFDDAIADGVDIISVSAGSTPPQVGYFNDVFAIGSFHAFRKGILVACSAGNSGFPGSAVNVFPWMLTVAASSIDRQFDSYVHLGNSEVLRGTSLNPTGLDREYPVIFGSYATAYGIPSLNASYCKNNTLDHKKVAGKIVVCNIEYFKDDRLAKAVEVQQAGGVGMILVAPELLGLAFQFVIPTSLIGADEAKVLVKYADKERYPVAKISQTVTALNIHPAPQMASFSSMGPNFVTPDIIKPDITAPGVNILAAWSPVALAANQTVEYNIVSGTSMSCPHAAGAAAILKSRHPEWSPAAIMSAIMTTATVEDNRQKPILRYPNGSRATPFDYGSGHLNPVAAVNPGLVYDFGLDDMISFLCSNGATSDGLNKLTGQAANCDKSVPSYNFNYPSIGVAEVKGNMSVRRTVKNVQHGNWVYSASIEQPAGVILRVVPEKLDFSLVGEKRTYRIDVVPLKPSNGSFVFGSITWSNDIFRVRSPVGLKVVSM